MAYIRTVKTASGATAVQVVWSWRRGARSIEHIGSAHDEAELAALKSAAAARLAVGQTELDLGLTNGLEPGTLPITSSKMTHLWDGLCAAYRLLGFESVTKGDNVFGDLVLARISVGTDHRADQQDRRGPGAGRSWRRVGLLRHPQAPPTDICPATLAPIPGCSIRRPRPVGAGIAGVVRRLNAVLRNR